MYITARNSLQYCTLLHANKKRQKNAIHITVK